MKLNVTFSKRLKQFCCSHSRMVGLGCASMGINSMKGHYHVTYTCRDCGLSTSEWIKANKEEVEKLFSKNEWTIK